MSFTVFCYQKSILKMTTKKGISLIKSRLQGVPFTRIQFAKSPLSAEIWIATGPPPPLWQVSDRREFVTVQECSQSRGVFTLARYSSFTVAVSFRYSTGICIDLKIKKKTQNGI